MSTVAQIYKRTEVVGRGKFGIVYKGIHRATKQVYAIKVLNLDTSEDEVKDVQMEIQFLSHMKHVPNVTHYYGSYLNGSKLWIIMDYCAGGSLRTLLKPGKIEEKYIGIIVRELLIALQYIHKQNIIHRDIKAANVLITNDGKVMLCDFGVAAQLSSTSLRRNTMAGTPYWMAPEVIMEGTSYDVKADIWSLGITIYEIATGNPPYCDFEAMRAMQLITKSKPPRLDGMQYSSMLKETIALCLDENPMERLSADELLSSSKFIKFHKNSQTSLLKELISRYLLWREKKSSRESIIMNLEDELQDENNEIEVKWDFDSLSSNEYIMENDINVNNINLNNDDNSYFNFDENNNHDDNDLVDYDDGDDEFMTGYQGTRGLLHSNTGTINNYTKNSTYINNIGSTIKANDNGQTSTLNRKEVPKSLLNLFKENSGSLDEYDEDQHNEEQEQSNDQNDHSDAQRTMDLPRIPSGIALHRMPSTLNTMSNHITSPRDTPPPIVEIEIPNMDDIETQPQQQQPKPRSRANTLIHTQSAASVMQSGKSLDPMLQRRPTLTGPSSGVSQPALTTSTHQLHPSASITSGNNSQSIPAPSDSSISLPALPNLPPTISRSTPSPKRELNNLMSSPAKLSILTSSPSKMSMSMKAIQSPSNPSPLLQPLNNSFNSSLNASSQALQQQLSQPSTASLHSQITNGSMNSLSSSSSAATSANGQTNNNASTSKPVKRNHQNLRLQMPTPTTATFPKLLHTSSNMDEQDENVNQFGFNVSNVPMTMTPLTEKSNPHNNGNNITSQSITTTTNNGNTVVTPTLPTFNGSNNSSRKMSNGNIGISQQQQPQQQQQQQQQQPPPTIPFLTQRAGSSVSSHSSLEGGIMNGSSNTMTTMTTVDDNNNNNTSNRPVGPPTMDLNVFMDESYSSEKMNLEMVGLLNGLSNMLGQMEEKLMALNE